MRDVPFPYGCDLDAWEYSIGVPHDARGAGVARAAIRAALTAHELADFVDRALLLGSEKLANSYLHAKGPARMRLGWCSEILRLSVWDASPGFPEVRSPGDEAESGRGLWLLQSLADRWGHYVLPQCAHGELTKVVWCELTRRSTGELATHECRKP